MNSTPRPPLHVALWHLVQSYLPTRNAPRFAWLSFFLPTPGNLLFTLLLIGGLFWANNVGAVPLLQQTGSSISTIPYQGRLADASGLPLTGSYPMVFRLYAGAVGGTPLWEETRTSTNSVLISDGLFNVMLGTLTPIPQSVFTGNTSLWLGIAVGSDSEMTPRVQIGTLPFAVQALTVPDGSIATAKLADGAVTLAKLGNDVVLLPADGSITTAKLADSAVTSRKAKLQVGNTAGLSQSYALNNSDLILPATQVIINIETPSTVIINANFDFGLGVGATVAGNVRVDGTAMFPQAVASGTGLRTTAATNVLVNLEPGSHTIELQARLYAGSGAAVDVHTGYTYIVVAR